MENIYEYTTINQNLKHYAFFLSNNTIAEVWNVNNLKEAILFLAKNDKTSIEDCELFEKLVKLIDIKQTDDLVTVYNKFAYNAKIKTVYCLNGKIYDKAVN